MFITGPEVVKTVLGEEVSMEDLGGARVHACISGNAPSLPLQKQNVSNK